LVPVLFVKEVEITTLSDELFRIVRAQLARVNLHGFRFREYYEDGRYEGNFSNLIDFAGRVVHPWVA